MDTIYSERDSTFFVSSIKRKPISSSGTLIMPTIAEPAGEPLLMDQENDFNTSTKAFDHEKQPVSTVGVVPSNERIQSSAMTNKT
jgi:aminoglycoside N3'-acetyltransferase